MMLARNPSISTPSTVDRLPDGPGNSTISDARSKQNARASSVIRAGHVAGEMHHAIAIGDIDIELVERVAAEVLARLRVGLRCAARPVKPS